MTNHWLTLLTCVALAGCSEDQLSGSQSSLRFDPANVTVPAAWADGQRHPFTVTVVNEGRRTLDVTWAALPRPFEGELPAQLAPGENAVPLFLVATTPGSAAAVLHVEAEGVTPAEATVLALVKETPACVSDNPCVTTRFDFTREACVEENVADDTACDPGTLCLLNTSCHGGRCTGEARVCEDGNACTIDVCYPKTGCEFLPAPPCPGDGVCQVGVCDPQTGCGLAPREDGSTCGGLTTSCTEVDVCIAGQCVSRDPPDGYVCAEANPCLPEGRCLNDVCVRARTTTTPLRPTWSYDALHEGEDAGVEFLHDFVLEPDGQLSLSGFFGTGPVLRANGPAPLAMDGMLTRRCILWGQRYVCADAPIEPSGQISVFNLGTGQPVWTFGIRDAAPQFLPLVANIFLARIVVQSSDRLAAVYEAYPASAASGSTDCRRYFLAVIDAQGNLVQAQAVEDPLLDVCNHPHPYGVAADAQGNLFISFSPTVSNQAPLVPDDTTLIMSWSRDGIFRWKHVNQGLRGGELAVARGLLYAEYTDTVVEAVSGAPAFTVHGLLGRAVVSDARLIPAPHEGGTTLTGYEAGTSTPRWSTTLPGTSTFWSDQLRLASWRTSKGARTVALTWVLDGLTGLQPSYQLYGFDVFDGSIAFACPVDVPDRTPPQLFEVASGSLAMMNGALDSSTLLPGCNKCDPPLAYTSGWFHSLPTPLLSPAAEPWVGTFGGAGHDHHED